MIWLLLYIPFAIWFGRVNAIWASKVDWSKGIKIAHAWNGLIHISVAIGVYFFFDKGKHFDLLGVTFYTEGLKASAILLLVTKTFFDLSYIYFHLPQRLPITYQPSKPKAISDKVEILFIKNGLVAKIIYIFLIIILLTT